MTQFLDLLQQCHPERSRFSGEAKDLLLIERRALAKLHITK
jgi:hypothetical protein